MKQEVLCLLFAVAISLSVIHTHGLGISVDSEKISPSCCSNQYSKVHQSNRVIDGDRSKSLGGSKVFVSFVDPTLSSVITENATCTSTWLTPGDNSNCKCGSSLGGIVQCDNSSGKVRLLRCYVMTYGVNESTLVVGSSLYGCVVERLANPHYPLPSNTSELNELCSRYHRKGQLCGKCEEGFALPVYSYNTSCVNCTNHYANNWIQYLAVSLLPLTLFFFVIVTCRVKVTSGVMNAFILLCQMTSLPAFSRVLTLSLEFLYGNGISVFSVYAVSITVYSMWNLDFFRALYHPFCLHPETTTLQILALDYIIAVYPLVLLVVVYLFVKLHDSTFIVIYLWRPFRRCFLYFRKDWNVKTSLIDSFATFLLLSYVKFLSVSFDLLTPVHVTVLNIDGKTLSKHHLYWDAAVEFFGFEHLPYGILALTVVIIFNIIPLLLLCLYPCRCFQNCLNYCKIQKRTLHIFMDAFQGCYKDGTNGNSDCRWFAGLYLFIRILVMVLLDVTFTQFFFPLAGCIALLLLFLTAVFQPYKDNAHNRINIFVLIVLTFIVFSAMSRNVAISETLLFKRVADFMMALSFSIPGIYIIAVVLYKLFAHRIWVQRFCHILCRKCAKHEDEEFERILPERMVNVAECAALLADPMK